jgi:aminopeptidase N
MEVALGREVDGAVVVEAIPAEIAGPEAELPAAIGRTAPAFVFPNHNDHDFAKVALDPASVDYLRRHLERVEDPLLRQLIWQALWNMVRDQQLKSTEYLELVRSKAPTERDAKLVESILATATAAIGRFVPEERREPEAHALSDAAWATLQEAPRGDLQIIWARTLINVAVTPTDILRTGRLADGELSVPGLTVDQDMRWEIATRYTAFGLAGAEQRAELERRRDPSDRGQRAMIRIDAARSDPQAKEEAWNRINGEGYGSLQLTASAMRGFNWHVQRELLEPYVERYFSAVPSVFDTRDLEFAQRYHGALFPAYRVEPAILDRSRRLLEEVGETLPTLRRALLEANDDLERAIRCREFAAG